METRIPLKHAHALAVEVADLLRDSCMRLEVAGSMRRGRPDVGDLELVAIPRGKHRWLPSVTSGADA